jgi:hypothetical protein
MLGALVAVGLPILIHYLTRARPRRIPFPPFKFLLEACAGQRAVHRLRTILLLAVRCLAVLALVLLFARPFLKPTGAPAASTAAKRVVLVLDASVSMRAVQRGVSLFARAQAEAADVLRALEFDSEAAVLLAGATPRPLFPALSRNVPALHEELLKAQPTFEHGDMAAALALAKRLLGGGTGEVSIFSDFQQSNWSAAGELPSGLSFRLRPVTTEPVDNVALTAALVSPTEPVVGEPAEILCTVFNCTPRPRQERLRLELGDFSQEKRVSVPAFGTAQAAFNVTFPQAGPLVGQASLQPDDLREDDTRHLAVRVHKALQLLLVSDADATDPHSAAFFVSRAFAPSAQAAPGLSIVPRHSQDTDRGILETADAFVLIAPAQLTGEAADIIARRVREGAQVVVFLDGPTAPQLLLAPLNPPFQLLRNVVSPAGAPLVAGPRPLFADSDATDWSALRFRRYLQNRLLEGRADEVMLSYPDGSAALTLTKTGKGAVVFANLPLTPEGGDLIGSPMFPAMLHEVLRTLRRGSEDRFITPGAAWTLEAPNHGEGAVSVTDPDGQSVEAQVVASGRATRLALPPARLPGAYLAKQADTVVASAVVNVDPRESDTRPAALQKLKPGVGAAVTIVQDEEDLLLGAQARPLWPELAAAAAALLALEMVLLAWWRRGTGKTLPNSAMGLDASPKRGVTIQPRATPWDNESHKYTSPGRAT